MKQLALFVGVLAVSVSVASADDHKYTMKDLKALIDQKGYREVLQHLDDVSPSERNQDWIDIAGTAAGQYIGSASDEQKLGLMQAIEKQYPVVVKSQAYSKARLDAIPAAFSKCYAEAGGSWGDRDERMKGYDECIEVGQKFIDSEPNNPALPLALARATARTSIPFKSISQFKIAVAAAGKSGQTVCKEPGIPKGILNALHFATGKLRTDTSELAATCWSMVKPPLVAEVKKADHGSFKTNACAIMAGQKDYSADDKQACAGAAKP